MLDTDFRLAVECTPGTLTIIRVGWTTRHEAYRFDGVVLRYEYDVEEV